LFVKVDKGIPLNVTGNSRERQYIIDLIRIIPLPCLNDRFPSSSRFAIIELKKSIKKGRIFDTFFRSVECGKINILTVFKIGVETLHFPTYIPR
jgi:hypothetical protein